MKNIPLKELKSNLSLWAEKAHEGAIIQVTKYQRPYILLGPGDPPGLRRGARVGKGMPGSVAVRASQGRWLDFLTEDRTEDL